jgi:two-component system cell cycle sensor histidine kinase/response regulator CckA
MKTPPRARILVVDDEQLNRRLIQAILAPEGHEIVHATDGESALALIAHGKIDLVLLDVLMPGVGGIEVCRRIRTELAQPLLPVVLISALTDPTSRSHAKVVGADDFLTKPIHEDELLARVRNLLLVREYHVLRERQHVHAEAEARRWRLVSSVASAVAGCLDYQSVTDAIRHELKLALDVELTAYLEHDRRDDGLRLVAITPSVQSGEPGAELLHRCFESDNTNAGAKRVAALAIQPLLDARGLTRLIAFPISSGDERRGVLCLGRNLVFTESELRLLDDVSHHVANAIANVRAHARMVSRLRRQESQREEAEAALSVSEDRYRILFDASPLPIWVFDPKTLRILAVNDALVHTLGYSRQELLAMRVSEFKLPEDVPHLVRGMAMATSGRTKHVGVMRYVCKDRSVVEFDITSHATMLGGEMVMLALGLDVTDSRKIEEQLRQSQKMDAIGKLAGGVAHDFNNLIQAILGFSEIVREDLGDDHPSTPDIREVEATAHRAAVLTRQLLAFSRQLPPEVESVSLNLVVTEVEKMLTRIVGENIEMVTLLAPDVGDVEADRGQLEQVLVNLVVNARDAMPHGGQLVIETSNASVEEPQASQLGVPAGQFVTLTVRDNGHGMDLATQARIFEPFFTTKEVGRGTGLGLSTVFGIIKQCAGAISIVSEVGRGSTFRTYLPHIARWSATTEPRSRSTVALAASTPRILVVEDDDQVRATIVRQLRASGCELFEARNGAAALDLLPQIAKPLDLLLTDLVMPGLDGRALAQLVLAERPETKVLFMSGYAEHPVIKTTDVLTGNQCIEKPFTSADLTSAIRRTLDGRTGSP